MGTRHMMYAASLAASLALGSAWVAAKQDRDIRVNVEMVQLNVAVTDGKGNYINDLQPADFVVTEDEIPQQLAMFASGDEPPTKIGDTPVARPPIRNQNVPTSRAVIPTNIENPTSGETGAGQKSDVSIPQDPNTILAGTNVFVLFDTSNYMYKGFVFAQDAVANFVRSLEGPDKIAFYAYSRDLLRAAPMSPDRSQVMHGVRATVAGSDAALYDALLLTLKDAGQLTGRRAIVVFSNGPDSVSVAPPEDIRELAQSEGVPIYMISTREAKIEPISTAVFQRITSSTGGQVYFAKSWEEEQSAFTSIRNDLAHVYSLYYYPQPNPNRGWRALKVKLTDPKMKKFVIRTRTGYRPQTGRTSAAAADSVGGN